MHKHLENRARFVQTAFDNKEKAGDYLIECGAALKNCKSSTDIALALEQILYITDRSIWRDLRKDLP